MFGLFPRARNTNLDREFDELFFLAPNATAQLPGAKRPRSISRGKNSRRVPAVSSRAHPGRRPKTCWTDRPEKEKQAIA